jgi:hypothetical protein
LFRDLREAPDVDPSFWPGIAQLAPVRGESGGLWQDAKNCVLLGVKVSQRGRDNVWFVRLSSASHEEPQPGMRLAPFPVPMDIGSLNAKMRLFAPAERVWVETYDQQGTLLQSSIRTVPTEFGSSSAVELCRYIHMHSSLREPNVLDEINLESLAAVLIRLNTIATSRSVRPIALAVKDHVVRLPNVLEILASGFSRKVQLTVHESLSQVHSPFVLMGSVPSSEMRFQLRCAGQALFDGRLLCRPPEPPFHLTGGLLVLEAVHPENPHNRLTVRVLASRHRETESAK